MEFVDTTYGGLVVRVPFVRYGECVEHVDRFFRGFGYRGANLDACGGLGFLGAAGGGGVSGDACGAGVEEPVQRAVVSGEFSASQSVAVVSNLDVVGGSVSGDVSVASSGVAAGLGESPGVGSCLSGSSVEGVRVVGKHAARNRRVKEKRKERKKCSSGLSDVPLASFDGRVGACCLGDRCGCGKCCALSGVVSREDQSVLIRQGVERRKAENALAIQRAEYNFKRNAYLDRARISEKKWEQERLVCEQKLAKITEARFGSKPGYATTLLSTCEGSELPPSLSTGSDSPAELSDGTISPDSSMSVAEINAMKKKMEDLAGKVTELSMQNEVLKKGVRMSGGTVKIENGEAGLYDSFGCYIPPTVKYDSEAEFYLGGGADSECAFYE